MDYMTELTAIAKTHGGIIETKIAAQRGISKAMLYKLCKEDKIHRIVKGQYILPDDMQDELLAISNRSERIIFSHETALYLHGISDRTPFEHTVTAPSGCIPSAAIKSECKVYYIKPELFELGKTTLRTPAGNDVPAYDQDPGRCESCEKDLQSGPRDRGRDLGARNQRDRGADERGSTRGDDPDASECFKGGRAPLGHCCTGKYGSGISANIFKKLSGKIQIQG